MYLITNWERHFENNRTRDRKELGWVPFPNSHDGAGYAELLDHVDGPAHYGTWCAIVQVASRCQPRGTLIRSNGQPHDSASLARMIKFPTKIIEAALQRFVGVGWMSIQSQEGESSLPPTPPIKKKPAPADEPPASIAVMSFPCTGEKEWHLTLQKIAEYEQSFPGVNVMQECRVARQWCIDNPTKRKTFKGMPAFLSRWLTKQQDRGGSKMKGSPSDPRGTFHTGNEFLKSRGVVNGEV